MEKFSNYAEMRRKVSELFQDGKLDQAATLLEWALGQYPENLLANVYNLGTCYAFLNKPEDSLRALEYGLDRGIWYGKWDFEADFWNPVKEIAAFERIRTRSEACRVDVQKAAKPERVVIPPTNYQPERMYPLFIALHGGGESVEIFRPQWTSPRLENEFIVAYLQSSRVVSMTGFSWMGDDQDRKEIKDAYDLLLQDFSVDTDRILIGGFSSGGNMTLSLLLEEDEIVPARGFVVLCPPVPEQYSPQAIARIVDRKQRGMFLTTEMDNRLEDQRRIVAAFENGGVPLEFEVTPDIGHWYPPDLAEKIDEAVCFILE